MSFIVTLPLYHFLYETDLVSFSLSGSIVNKKIDQ